METAEQQSTAGLTPEQIEQQRRLAAAQANIGVPTVQAGIPPATPIQPRQPVSPLPPRAPVAPMPPAAPAQPSAADQREAARKGVTPQAGAPTAPTAPSSTIPGATGNAPVAANAAMPPAAPTEAQKAEADINRLRSDKLPVQKLEDKAKGIQNKWLRIPAEIGSGILGVGQRIFETALPGPAAGIPGTRPYRAQEIVGEQERLANAQKGELTQAQTEEARTKATGAAAQTKLQADMAAKGYSPVTDATGKTSWQFTGKGEDKTITDDRRTLPDGSQNPNFGKSVLASVAPNGAVLNYGPLAGAKEQAGAPTAESIKLETDQMEQALSAGNLDEKQRPVLQQREHDQIKRDNAGAYDTAVGIYGSVPPVPADYPKGSKDPQYIKDEARWGKALQKAKEDPKLEQEHQKEIRQNTQAVNKVVSKAVTDYTAAKGQADTLAAVVREARAGNKVASAAVSSEGVLTISTAAGVKRISPVEFQNIEGAGSFIDRINKYVGKQFSGQAIPPDLLDAFAGISRLMKKEAYSKYSDTYESMKDQYEPQGVNFGRIGKVGPPHTFNIPGKGTIDIDDREVKDFKKHYPNATEVQ